MTERAIHILYMFPDLLNMYYDRGNVICMAKRLEWRGITAQVRHYTNKDVAADFTEADIVFIGGGSDKDQRIVAKRMQYFADALTAYIESGGVTLAVCAGYQLLGQYYEQGGERIDGVGALDVYTTAGTPRLIGDIVVRSDIAAQDIIGFENHGGRTYIGEHTPLGRVVKGHGNNGVDGTEGVAYKNTIATYLHGPLLPKNPALCDDILERALSRKYGDMQLEPLDDTFEQTARRHMFEKFRISTGEKDL